MPDDPEFSTFMREFVEAEAAKKSDLERTDLAKDKSGVFTGAHAINPANNNYY